MEVPRGLLSLGEAIEIIGKIIVKLFFRNLGVLSF